LRCCRLEPCAKLRRLPRELTQPLSGGARFVGHAGELFGQSARLHDKTKHTAAARDSQLSLDAAELATVCVEVERALAGRPVQKIVQPDRSTVLFGLKGGWLLVSVDPQLGRLHLTEKPAGTGASPPAFCMLLRKELVGARLKSVRAVRGERACELVFGTDGGAGERRLRAFLFGRAGQLQLVGDADRVLGHIGPARQLHASLPPAREPAATEVASEIEGAIDGLSARIEARFAALADERARTQARTQALATLKSEIDRQARKVEALERDRARAVAAGDKRKLGDLLFAHLHELPRGAAEVTLPDDFGDGTPIRIALDPARGPRENAERFYKEHKRLGRALAGIDERLAATRQALERARREHARIEAGAALPAAALVPAMNEGALPARRKKQEGPAPPFRLFRSSTGAQILVGRGADRNDELTFQVARGSDLWLHARDVAGAHVIVRLPSGGSIDEQTLLDAATLAAHHSAARGEAQVDVGYTLRKHVRKPPKSRPGTVTFSSLKTIRVRLEADRLQRLLASLED
jgi:predicted ribosome quality control (RQC) complex YloA/Tae2 family protein